MRCLISAPQSSKQLVSHKSLGCWQHNTPCGEHYTKSSSTQSSFDKSIGNEKPNVEP